MPRESANGANDIEKGGLKGSEYLAGYPDFAAFIASGKELAIYRAFDRLSARNILYLQSELLYLQDKLEEFDRHDLEAKSFEEKMAARCWQIMAEPSNDHDRERLELIRKIRPVLKEYSRVLRAMRNWFIGEDKDNSKKTLVGLDEKLFDEADDLIALRPAQGRDRLSKLLQQYGFFFKEDHRNLPPSWGGITYFPEKRIHQIVTVANTVLAAILLVGAIVSLYVVKPQIARLGMVGGFTTVFAASLGLLTKASQAEVFTATAA
ncbi:hypothetical protein GP486_002479 [Trichoglossum hirsutum]|uniref:DUF6594 domain-containing protein n=1 Tax=Trichoglossum hirsutum TaxID=265104 RepID=A0A9P8RRN7_9PEZI|nr:hypothetical protein GP486_002479 [Trichoglossum hirsutum]